MRFLIAVIIFGACFLGSNYAILPSRITIQTGEGLYYI